MTAHLQNALVLMLSALVALLAMGLALSGRSRR